MTRTYLLRWIETGNRPQRCTAVRLRDRHEYREAHNHVTDLQKQAGTDLPIPLLRPLRDTDTPDRTVEGIAAFHAECTAVTQCGCA